MTSLISIMMQICLLVAMLMMCSNSDRGSDNLREAAETESIMDDNIEYERRQEETVCGRIQILTSKRDDGTGGSNDLDQSDHLDKILGGSDVTYGQVPWHVNIFRERQRKCGGAIINEFWVLTAASCVLRASSDQLKLVVGDHRLSRSDRGQKKYNVQRIVTRAGNTIPSRDYDIALIKVKHTNGSGIIFNNYVQPICLPVVGESPADNADLTVSGWGDSPTELNTQYSDTLQTAVLPVMNRNQCREALPSENITERLLCVGRTSGGDIDVCLLDYGGPATFQSGDTHILAGIIIAGSYCSPPMIFPAFLINVLALREWIDDRINVFSNYRQRLIPFRAD